MVELSVSRDRGQLFLPAPNGLIDNVYELHLTNRSERADRYRIEVEGMPKVSILGGDVILVPSGELLEIGIRLRADPENLPYSGTQILFRAVSTRDESVVAEAESRFIRPAL